MNNRTRLLILAATALIVAGVAVLHATQPAEITPDFRTSLLNSSEEEVRCRLGEPTLCVDQDGKRALAYEAVRVGREVKPVVVYLSEDRAVSVTSEGVELP